MSAAEAPETGVCGCPLPPEALLRRHADAGAYADCYTTEAAARVTHADFVEAFYTTAVFKLERGVLRLLAARPSTDAQAGQLARGEIDTFAAWVVEARAPRQLLLRDMTGRTRSWLMVGEPSAAGTRLFFGSAVVPARRAGGGNAGMGFAFTALLGFHKLYSRVLLGSARARLAGAGPRMPE